MDITEARIKTQAMVTTFGGGLPRAFTTLIARSAALGPLISSAFSVVAPLFFLEMLVHISEKFKALSDDVMGYTKEVKKMYEEDVKGSTAMLSHASSVTEAYQRIADQNRIIGQISQETWAEKVTKEIDKAKQAQSGFWDLLPGGIGAVHELAAAWQGVAHGAAAAADAEAVEVQAREKSMLALRAQNALVAERKVKEAESVQSTRTLGMTRVQALQDEIKAMGRESTRREEFLFA